MKNLFCFVCSVLLGGAVALAADAGGPEEGHQTFLAHNLWYENPQGVSAIGYKRGTMIPVGMEVKDVIVGRSAVVFTVVEWNIQIRVVLDKHQKNLLTVNELRDRMITHKNKEQLTEGLTEQELDAVSRGMITPGISQRAALIAYGYPPKHRTPSTEMTTWVYWTSRFVNRSVEFNDDGKALNGIGN